MIGNDVRGAGMERKVASVAPTGHCHVNITSSCHPIVHALYFVNDTVHFTSQKHFVLELVVTLSRKAFVNAISLVS